MTAVGNTPAPAPSPAEAAEIARFGIFEAEEREAAVIEEMARAIEREMKDLRAALAPQTGGQS